MSLHLTTVSINLAAILVCFTCRCIILQALTTAKAADPSYPPVSSCSYHESNSSYVCQCTKFSKDEGAKISEKGGETLYQIFINGSTYSTDVTSWVDQSMNDSVTTVYLVLDGSYTGKTISCMVYGGNCGKTNLTSETTLTPNYPSPALSSSSLPSSSLLHQPSLTVLHSMIGSSSSPSMSPSLVISVSTSPSASSDSSNSAAIVNGGSVFVMVMLVYGACVALYYMSHSAL